MKRVARLFCCIVAMLVLTSLHVCYGQDVSGMTGEVTDPSGAAVTGATVTLKNAATGLQFTATYEFVLGQKHSPQGLKPIVFPTLCGPTKVVP